MTAAAMTMVDLLTRLWRHRAAHTEAPVDKLTTTGFVATAIMIAPSPGGDEPVALSAVLFNGGRQGPALTVPIRPAHTVPDDRAMEGMDAATRAAIAPAARALARFDAVCARRIVVAHDLDRQMAVLANARGPRVSMAPQLGLDTRQLARALGLPDGLVEPTATHLSLPPASGPEVERRARATGELLLALLPKLRARGARTLRDLLDLQRRTFACR